MSEVKVNKISPRTACGTTTLGDSGDTFNIPCGSKINVASGGNITVASGATITNNGTQTGFGRTGTVDWATTVKTGDFTAVSGNGYFINTTSGGVTMTLPSSPSAGDIVSCKDYAYKFATNALTVGRNGSNIGGGSDYNPTYTTDGAFLTFIYIDVTQGWLLTDESNNTTDPTNVLVSATGGTITCCGDYKIHTFTGPGTFCVTAGAGSTADVSYVVVAGGAGGGKSSNGTCRYGGGGGGAGGYRESKGPADSYTASPFASTTGVPVSAGPYPITVGGGGPVGPGGGGNPGGPGSNSIFTTITATGGGGGTSDEGNSCAPNKNGGSGGGGSAISGANPAGNPGGDGNSPPVSPPQGYPGYAGSPAAAGAGGGGGLGGPATATPFSLTGKNGATSSINGTPTARAGGGGGGSPSGTNSGGTGGGGASGIPASAGTTNSGGGGGGSNHSPGSSQSGAAGGSGIVIIRYKFQ